jgi:hypothetical protein
MEQRKALIRLALTRDPPSLASGRSEERSLISLLPLAGEDARRADEGLSLLICDSLGV